VSPTLVAALDPSRAGRPTGTGTKPARLKATERPFIAMDPALPIWEYCKPEYKDTIPITYGLSPMYARELIGTMSAEEQHLIIERREICRTPNRAFQIWLRRNERIASSQGGFIWLKNSRGQTATIYDVKGLFQLAWSQVRHLYKSDDLASIMTRTRESLANVGLGPYKSQWYRCSSVADNLWRRLERDLDNFGLRNVPAVQAPKGRGNLQGYGYFGHTDEPVYSYDIRSAYLAVMAEFPALRPFTDRLWAARRDLEEAHDPAAFILKLTATVIPGKFGSARFGGRYYRPVLAQYIRQRVNQQLTDAIHRMDGDRVYRWCVDGFLAGEDISHRLDIGSGLGQWKPLRSHSSLTIAGTNLWWTNRDYKNNGYLLTEDQVLKDPFHIETARKVFNWQELEDATEQVTIDQPHDEFYCQGCQDGTNMHTVWRTPAVLGG
jgi:hypothetical protein